MTDKLHEITKALNDVHFPLKKRRIRSTDDPWIDDQIKREIRRRKRRFDRQRRGPGWTKAKKRTDELIREAKKTFTVKLIRNSPQMGPDKYL